MCTYVCRSVIGYVGVDLDKYACVQAHTVHIVTFNIITYIMVHVYKKRHIYIYTHMNKECYIKHV